MKKSHLLLGTFLALSKPVIPIALPSSIELEGTVDLHAHLFMKDGMGWAFRGSFDGPLQAKSWKDRFSSQANPAELERSGNTVVVMTIYAHPLFVGSLRQAVRQQIQATLDFTRLNSQWILAKTPQEAVQARKQGKKILILALEGIAGILETEEDIKEFVVKGGIRIVTPLHLTDDRIGGAAFLKGLFVLANPWPWLTHLISPRQAGGVKVNKAGLSEFGKVWVERLIKYKVWIDLSHASDQSQSDLIPLLARAKQPHLFTHTVMRKFHGAERGISSDQLLRVKETQGIVGLMPSEEMLEGTIQTEGKSESFVEGESCSQGFRAFAKQYDEISEVLGSSEPVMIGSDTNGGIPHLGSGCAHGLSTDKEGYWNIGQTHEVWKALEKESQKVPHPKSKMVDRFLRAWNHVYENSH